MSRLPLIPTPEKVAAWRQKLGLDADNLPLTLTPAERQAATTPEPKMPETTAPAVSPTGTPVVSQNVLKIVGGLLFVVASAVVIKQPDLIAGTEIDQQVAGIMLAILGFLSPGWRRKA